jgi:hypothetical protein
LSISGFLEQADRNNKRIANSPNNVFLVFILFLF